MQQHDHGAHGHDHSHHSHGRGASRRRLSITLALVLLYTVAEALGGLWTGSLALLADAGHMLSDAGALALSLFAMWIAERPPTRRRTYGYYRTEILAALVNGATLVAISIYIFIEAYGRLQEPVTVQGAPMMGIAAGGLLVNLAGLWLLHGGRDASLNMRGAWLHVLSDALGSVGAIAGGFLVWQFGWRWADPAVSVLIGLLVVISSWTLLRESVNVLMEGAPSHIDVDRVRDAIMSVPRVTAVHDLHVWSITSGMVALSAHVLVRETDAWSTVLRDVRAVLHDEFGIDHTTIQVEEEGMTEAGRHA